MVLMVQGFAGAPVDRGDHETLLWFLE